MKGFCMKDVIEHYDRLIDEGNDPVFDTAELKAYMDTWDGVRFVDSMQLEPHQSVLEVGVGTGRLALRVAPHVRRFLGVDISPKTVKRGSDNLSAYPNVTLLCADFMEASVVDRFDVIYSSLTFMHIKDKPSAIQKIASLLNDGGRFVLSIDKNQSEWIDMGTRKVEIYPDQPEKICTCLVDAGLVLIDRFETEHAHVLVAKKPSPVGDGLS